MPKIMFSSTTSASTGQIVRLEVFFTGCCIMPVMFATASTPESASTMRTRLSHFSKGDWFSMKCVVVLATPLPRYGMHRIAISALAMIAAVGIAAFTLLTGLTTTAGGGLLAAIGGSFMILVGVMVGLIILCGGIGWFLGKRS